jgi:hypothetical protein
LSIVVSEGSKDSSRSNQSSGSSTLSQNQLVLSGKNIVQNTMVGVDPTLRMPLFQGVGSEDPEQHLFICDTIWTVKNVQDDDVKIVQLEMTFRDHALLWYMKYHNTTPVGQTRTLAEVRQALLKEFQKPKSQSQCITELKEIKKIVNESVWDYDQRFKILKDRLTFQIPDEQHREWFIAGLFPHICFPLMQQKIVTVRSSGNCYEIGSIPCRRK